MYEETYRNHQQDSHNIFLDGGGGIIAKMFVDKIERYYAR